MSTCICVCIKEKVVNNKRVGGTWRWLGGKEPRKDLREEKNEVSEVILF